MRKAILGFYACIAALVSGVAVGEAADEMESQPSGQNQEDRVSIAYDPAWRVLGSKKAKLVLVDFNDYQCPYCAKFDANTLPKLKKAFIDKGKLQYVVRDLPLDFHTHSRKMARAGWCANDQGKFWRVHARIFIQPFGTWKDEREVSKSLAKMAKLDVDAFEKCLKATDHDAKIEADIAAARTLGIAATPTFILGQLKDGRVQGVFINGNYPTEVFEHGINEALEKWGSKTSLGSSK